MGNSSEQSYPINSIKTGQGQDFNGHGRNRYKLTEHLFNGKWSALP